MYPVTLPTRYGPHPAGNDTPHSEHNWHATKSGSKWHSKRKFIFGCPQITDYNLNRRAEEPTRKWIWAEEATPSVPSLGYSDLSSPRYPRSSRFSISLPTNDSYPGINPKSYSIAQHTQDGL